MLSVVTILSGFPPKFPLLAFMASRRESMDEAARKMEFHCTLQKRNHVVSACFSLVVVLLFWR